MKDMSDAGLRIGGDAGRGARVRVRFDERIVDAYEGESLSAALWAAGLRAIDATGGDVPARVLFCAMGVCQQCAVWVDGRRVEACRTPVRDGLVATSAPPRDDAGR